MVATASESQRITDQVYDGLLGMISSGRLAKGDRVKIRDVAAELNVSATPVREAIALLVRDHVLAFAPNKGATVRAYSREQIEELFEVRAVLEGLAARRAATSDRREELVEKLREQIVLMRDAIERLDRPAYNRYDLAFHRVALSYGSSAMTRACLRVPELLTGVFWTMREEDRREVRGLRARDPKVLRRFREGVAHHETLVDAIAGGDGERAERMARDHVMRFVRSGLHVRDD